MRPVNIFWFRRDLRLSDNAGLYHALRSNNPVLPVFIFDKNILDKLENKHDSRVEFIHHALTEVQDVLAKMGSSIEVFHSDPQEAFTRLLTKYKIEKVFTNHDYEPYACKRDRIISGMLQEQGISFHSFKDQVIFEKDEILKDDGKPYTVFTPYSKKWRSSLDSFMLKAYSTEKYLGNFYKQPEVKTPGLNEIGFVKGCLDFPLLKIDKDLIIDYKLKRDFPAIEGTSKMGVHLRFGTISIRELARKSIDLSEAYMNELIWRDFYQMILWHFPQVGEGKAFKPEYDRIEWRNDNGEFEKWCKGQTGYPIVDAGMWELNETGYMHNRVRMIVASFLSKHLLIDWRLGEAYFAGKLLDFDLAANNGGWQWAAGSGCDAAPYFRIFNPQLQTQKFDPKLEYVKKWVPEINEFHYPTPIVDHVFARKRCLEVYGKTLKKDLPVNTKKMN